MSKIFLTIVNMSISASYLAIAVMLLRLLLRKAPKWITVLLWGIVAVRLVCPVFIESEVSLIPRNEWIKPPEVQMSQPIELDNIVVDPSLGENVIVNYPQNEPNITVEKEIDIPLVLGCVWLAGIAALLVYTAVSYIVLKRRVGRAVRLRDNIYQSENVVSPFVLGFIKPRIYLPFNIDGKDICHVIAHEKAHIRRKDHLWKPMGFILLSVHWFNPLMWLGYILLCRDIELACDEKVVKELDREARADYSEALLTCSVNRRMIAACPIAFGEVGVKGRVKSVLNYKKPAFWIIIAAVVACVAVAVCFLTNPKGNNYGETDPNKLNEAQISLMSNYPEYFGLDASDGLDVYVWQMSANSYYFGLLSHAEQGRDWITPELLNLRGTNAEQMSIILSTYNIDEDDIYIIPWQNPLSSYLGEWQIVGEGEDTKDLNAKRQAYVDRIRAMLFETTPNPNEPAFIWNFPLESDSDKFSYIYIRDLGCDVKDVTINFERARFEDGKLILDIRWTNEGSENIDIGPDFEVYKYNGSKLEKLEQLGYWNLNREILAGKGMNVAGNDTVTFEYEKVTSYNLSAHYDVLTPGKYRFEAHGAWVEFQIVDTIKLISSVYDTATFDVDGDGKEENCSMQYGRTSGVFTFIFLVQDKKTSEVEYETVIYSDWYKLSFVNGEDGVVRVQGIDENDEIHLFDISIVDGNIHLSENGMSIERVVNYAYSILYAEPSLSWVPGLSDIPVIAIENGILYQKKETYIDGGICARIVYTKLGTAFELSDAPDDLKALAEKYGSYYSELVKDILDNNDRIYRIDPEDKEGVSLYYVMYQKDGSVFIVYGHYENGEKTDFVRWIFKSKG